MVHERELTREQDTQQRMHESSGIRVEDDGNVRFDGASEQEIHMVTFRDFLLHGTQGFSFSFFH